MALFEDYLNRYGESERAGETSLFMGDISFDRRDWIRAADYYGKAGTILGDDKADLKGEARFKEALSLQKKREWDRAAESFLALAESDPEGSYGTEALYQGGICLLESGDTDSARAIFEEAVALTTGEVRERSLYQLARLALSGGDREEAVRLALQMREEYPDSELGANLFFSEAEDAWATGDFPQAREWYLLCRDVFPDLPVSAQASLRASLALAEAGHTAEAREELYRGLREGLARGEGESLNGRATALGRLMGEERQPDEARALLTEIYGLTDNIFLLAPLAIGAERAGADLPDMPGYLEEIYRSEELPFSQRSEALLLLARYRAEEGREDEAEAFYRVVMESDKGALGAEANYRAGELIARQDELRGAQELLNVSYNYPRQEEWAARALYRSWEIYTGQEEGTRKADIVKEKLLSLYPESLWASRIMR